MAISDLRQGLVNNLQTITGLRVIPTLPDVVNPPQALIALDKIDYQQQNNNSMNVYTFKITIVLGRVSERTAQQNLDVLVAPTGVKAAIESDRTLGGFAYEVNIQALDAYGAISINGIDYLSAEFSVLVYAR
jgi:hypothetical protein